VIARGRREVQRREAKGRAEPDDRARPGASGAPVEQPALDGAASACRDAPEAAEPQMVAQEGDRDLLRTAFPDRAEADRLRAGEMIAVTLRASGEHISERTRRRRPTPTR
jgi:hypothetical protein